ncbi:metallophosphoesterase [Arcobacter nitrofigilis DSM 7299]|uniref:Metallophosphoesterase n=1 Tax=Arcobacter nitrofigilis (strain ATCC 33309 / DSM 7299 / CCUG 15893 / LMG 7604 / NCTC 12251 / CI) TaxID=572480 RepID=D5V804_ARCNC|nr:metallophosphoesterase [Arcobacter nitrofigilis]ADG94774.1 metallophosphoesterase [Arcobacter nitrofigilis DSM 7299]
MKLPSLKEIEVFVKAHELEGLKILHLSDIHINKKTSLKNIQDLVTLCNLCEVDFVVITGDIIDCKVKYILDKLKVLNSIEKKVFYISGNHDLFYGFEELKPLLENFILLDNETYFLKYKNAKIALAGLGDRFSKFFKIKREENKVINFLSAYENSIFLAHQPKDYKFALKANAKLFLCGHTHGGQIYPFHYVVRLFQPFLAGLFYIKQTAIYVNKGLGYWGIDFRYKANSEITLLKLTSKSVE